MKNTQMKHTPTPWHVGGVHVKDSKAGYLGIRNGTQAVARCLVTDCIPYEEADANAAFIVRAVNAHGEMLKALKDALFVIKGQSEKGNYMDSSERDISLEGVLEQAIARAEGL